MKITNLNNLQREAIATLEKDFCKENLLNFLYLCRFGSVKLEKPLNISQEDINWITEEYNKDDGVDTIMTALTLIVDKHSNTIWISPTLSSVKKSDAEMEEAKKVVGRGRRMTEIEEINYRERTYAKDLEFPHEVANVAGKSPMICGIARLVAALNCGNRLYRDGNGNKITMIDRNQFQLELEELKHLLPFSIDTTEVIGSDQWDNDGSYDDDPYGLAG